jgi:hypothetical protein
MIQTDEQWARTREAIFHLERALKALDRDRVNLHPDRYRLMAEPILDDIYRLRAEIDQYIGLTAALEAGARPLPAEELAEAAPLPQPVGQS